MYLQSIPCAAQNPVPSPGGMGCAGLCCGGSCGLGLFDSGFDFSTWGVGEWAVAAGGLYLLFSVFSTTQRGTQAVGRAIRRRRRTRKLRAAII